MMNKTLGRLPATALPSFGVVRILACLKEGPSCLMHGLNTSAAGDFPSRDQGGKGDGTDWATGPWVPEIFSHNSLFLRICCAILWPSSMGATKNDQQERRSRYAVVVGILAILVAGVERVVRRSLPDLRLMLRLKSS